MRILSFIQSLTAKKILIFILVLSVTSVGTFALFRLFKIENKIAKLGNECKTTETSLTDYLTLAEQGIEQEETFKLLNAKSKNLQNLIAKYSAASNKEAKDNLTKDIKQLAQEKIELLIKVSLVNPDLAFANILSLDLKTELENIAPGCSPGFKDIEGIIEAYHFDIFDKKGVDTLTLISKDGRRFILHLHFARGYDDLLISGTKVAMSGYQIGNHFLIDGKNTDNIKIISTPNLTQDAAGTQSTLILLADFADLKHPNLTKTQVEETFFDRLKSFVSENSYEKTNIEGAVHDWQKLKIEKTCEPDKIINETLKSADKNYNYNNYQRIFVITPLSNCEWTGFSSLGKISLHTNDGEVKASVSLTPAGRTRIGTVAHQIGHNFGLNHSLFLNCNEESIREELCTEEDYGDLYSVMGEPRHRGHFNSAHKELLGWLTKDNLITVGADDIFELSPYELSTKNTKALKILRSADDAYYLEFRQPEGFDVNLENIEESDIFNGALIHTLKDKNKTFLLDASPPADKLTPVLTIGSTYEDQITHTKFRVLGKRGNLLRISVELGIVDLIPPEISIINPSDEATVTSTVEIKVNASDASGIEKVEYFFLGESLPFATTEDPPFTVSWDTTKSANGVKRIYAKAYDKALNKTDSKVITVVVNNSDKTPPSASIKDPKDGTKSNNPVTVTADVSDNIGIDRVEFYKDDDKNPFFISKFEPHTTSLIFSEGSHTVYIIAYDNVGNKTQSSKVSFSVEKFEDKEEPAVVITSPLSGQFFRNLFTITVNATDNVGIEKVEFYQDNQANPFETKNSPPYQIVVDASSLADGPHIFTAKAVDKSGNTKSATVNVITDNTNPTVNLIEPTINQTLSGSSVLIQAEANDNIELSRVDFFVDGALIGSITNSPYALTWDSTTVSDGTHTISVEAVDSARNNANIEINVIVSNEIPSPSPTSTPDPTNEPSPQPTEQPSPTPTPTTEPEFTPTPTPSPLPGDTTPPNVSITFPANGSTIIAGSTITITANASDNVSVNKVEFYVGGALRCTDFSSPYSCSWNVPSAVNKSYELQAKAYDTSGNTDSHSVTVTAIK